MRPVHAVAAFVLLAGVGAALAYQATAREEQYRRLLGRGDLALAAADTFGAIEAYSGAIALRPDSMLAHLRRGETYQRRGDLAAAARDLRRATALAPAAPQPLDALGDVFLARNRFDRAAELFEERLRLDDSSPHITYRLALARYRAGRLDAALAALADTIGLASDIPAAHYLAGLCLREQGRLVESAASFERSLALSPSLIEAREELADVYAMLRRPADHLEQLQILSALDRQAVGRQVAVALAQARAGRPETAVLTLTDRLERSPDQPLVYAALGQIWLDVLARQPDRPDALPKALNALDRAASTGSASSETLALYGRALLMSGRPDEAEAALRQAVERYPLAPIALLEFAALAERRRLTAAARTALIDYDALVGDAADAPARAGRIARLSMQAADPAAAAVWFARAIERGREDIEILTSLATAQMDAGHTADAQKTIARGFEIQPAHGPLQALARRLGRSGKPATGDSASGR